MRVNLSFTIPDGVLSDVWFERHVAEFLMKLPGPVKSVVITRTPDSGDSVTITEIVDESDERLAE